MKICLSSLFKAFIILCIIANTAMLALDKSSYDQKMIDIQDKVNLSFYTIFACEMVVKLLGLGFKEYYKDKFNCFDFVIVIVSSIDVGLT